MRFSTPLVTFLASLVASALALPGPGANVTCTFSDQPGRTACDGPLRRSGDPQVQRIAFETFLDVFYVQQNYTKAFLTFVHPSYIQHNPFIPDGRDATLSVLTAMGTAPTGTYTLLRHGLSNGTAWLHSRAAPPGSPATALADIWRMEGPCIMEHWDVIQAVPANATNPHPMF